MNQSVRRIDVPSVPLPPQPPLEDEGPPCGHGLIWCQCNTPPPPSETSLEQALNAERAARADACLSYANEVLQIPLTSWQTAIVRALYMGEHVRVGRAWGLHTVERVIEQHEASRGDAT